MKSIIKGFRLKYVMIITLFGRKMCFIAQNAPVHKVACFFSRMGITQFPNSPIS